MRPVPYPRRQATGDRRLVAKGVAVVLGATSVGACTWWWVRAVAAGPEQVSANIQTVAGATEETPASIREIAHGAGSARKGFAAVAEARGDTLEVVASISGVAAVATEDAKDVDKG
jgi:hypothetical protein